MTGQKKQNFYRNTRFWRTIIYFVVAALVVFLILSQYQHFLASINALKTANQKFIAISIGLMGLTFFFSSAIYYLLAIYRIKYWRTFVIQLAAALATRLLPAGIGGMGLNGDYLFRRKHSLAEATAVVSVNNALGILANIILFAAIIIFSKNDIPTDFSLSPKMAFAGLLLMVILLFALALLPAVRMWFIKFSRNFFRSLRLYLRRPARVYLALMLAAGLTLIFVSIFTLSSLAVGVNIGFDKTLIVFSIGTLIGAATPTPGGLVGVEAGLFAGLEAYNIASTPALAAVLLYRLISYWLPLIPGLAALLLARKRGLV